jgi:hypothetical protein
MYALPRLGIGRLSRSINDDSLPEKKVIAFFQKKEHSFLAGQFAALHK